MESCAKPKRDKTFKILYEGIPKRPSRAEVIDFIVDKLFAGEYVTRIQMCSSTATVYVETETLEQAQKIVRENQGKHFITLEGTAHPIPIAMEDGATEMRLHELPPFVTEDVIRKEMACFGEIISVAETVYGPETKVPGVKTGIRQVMIVLNNPALQIGPTLAIAGERTTVTYTGQKPYCRYCLMPEHIGMGCMQSKRSLAKQTSYAAIAQANKAKQLPKKNTTPKQNTNQKSAAAPSAEVVPQSQSAATAASANIVTPTNALPTPAPSVVPVVQCKMISIVEPTPCVPAPAVEDAALACSSFKTPCVPSPISPLSDDVKGKRKNIDGSDSDASSTSIGGTIKRKPGRPPKNPKSHASTIEQDRL